LAVVINLTAEAKPNVWCEVGEWSASSVLLGSSLLIDNMAPLFPKPLLGGATNLSYIEKETVNEIWIGAAGAGVFGAILLIPNRQGFFNETSYRNAKGFYEAVAVNNFITNSTKIVVGRKRPDYDDRVRLGKDTLDGRKAFWSGHASSSFGIATYASLYVFEHIGDTKKPLVIGAKAVAGLGLYTLAGYIAGTRVHDHLHHPSDVVAGALAGSASSLFFYGLQNGWWFHKNSPTGLGWEVAPGRVRISLTIP